jgi:HEAT repeat protein
VRLKAAWALSQIADVTTADAVKSALQKETAPQTRRALVRALVRSGAKSEAILAGLLNSSDAATREAAVRGLAGRHSVDPWPWPWPRPRPFP